MPALAGTFVIRACAFAQPKAKSALHLKDALISKTIPSTVANAAKNASMGLVRTGFVNAAKDTLFAPSSRVVLFLAKTLTTVVVVILSAVTRKLVLEASADVLGTRVKNGAMECAAISPRMITVANAARNACPIKTVGTESAGMSGVKLRGSIHAVFLFAHLHSTPFII